MSIGVAPEPPSAGPTDTPNVEPGGREPRSWTGPAQVQMLRAYTESSDGAVVHLACRTTLERDFGPTPTSWVLRVERQDDGTWKITHVTWISLAGRSPASDIGL